LERCGTTQEHVPLQQSPTEWMKPLSGLAISPNRLPLPAAGWLARRGRLGLKLGGGKHRAAEAAATRRNTQDQPRPSSRARAW
jgi:hypothetical protein